MTQTKTGPGRIKGRLPKDTPVAHKTGTTAIVINDAGLITLPSDSRIPDISRAVYVAGGSTILRMERVVAELSAAAFEFFSGKKLERPTPPRRRRVRRI